jgi:hypothetical protein
MENEAIVSRNSDKIGWHEASQHGRGAVALVFSRDGVMNLLRHQHMIRRPTDPNRGWRAVDGGVVTAFEQMGRKEYIHNPSLVQHIGEHSTMQNKSHKQALTFRGEDFDALTMEGMLYK